MLLTGARAIKLLIDDDELENYQSFLEKLDRWVHSSQQKVHGIPSNKTIVSGVTDAFNQTYGLYDKIGIFKGEYGYHKQVLDKSRLTYNLKDADIIILSHPFSADGMSAMDKLYYADSFGKPIFVDCAFFGICHEIEFDFRDFKNIHSVCFSLSKTFGSGWWRTGIIYSIDSYPSFSYSKWNYDFIAGAQFHYDLIDKISPDYIPNTFKDQQEEICLEYGLLPSNTIIFGIDHTEKYKDYARGNGVNRVCISQLFNIDGKF